MGLTLCAVSKGYRYSKKKDDMIGKMFNSVDVGYGGFMSFRNALLKFASGGAFSHIVDDDLFGKSFSWCWFKDKTFVVIMTKEQLENDDDYDKEYFDKLNWLKNNYPKLYDIYPFLVHCDCEGEMPLEQVEKLLPIVKTFYTYNKHNYGYSAWEYNFTKEFIKVLSVVVEKKGKLYFS